MPEVAQEVLDKNLEALEEKIRLLRLRVDHLTDINRTLETANAKYMTQISRQEEEITSLKAKIDYSVAELDKQIQSLSEWVESLKKRRNDNDDSKDSESSPSVDG
ncbi:MAG: hypothetical protein LUC43_05135 [Burkholderiales bacterium]|nr:hypothetical protein [Burkholderiales bacterium]